MCIVELWLTRISWWAFQKLLWCVCGNDVYFPASSPRCWTPDVTTRYTYSVTICRHRLQVHTEHKNQHFLEDKYKTKRCTTWRYSTQHIRHTWLTNGCRWGANSVSRDLAMTLRSRLKQAVMTSRIPVEDSRLQACVTMSLMVDGAINSKSIINNTYTYHEH